MTSIDQPLNNGILLVTGGASGIGFCVVKQAYELGTRVLVADLRTTPDFDSFAAGKDNIVYVQADVTRWSDFDKLFDVCEKKWSDVPDAYAICAGLFEPDFSNFWKDTEKDEGYMQVDVNVNHPIKLTRLAIRKSLGAGKRASVCIIASLAGIGGNIGAPLYCATKHAIIGFVKSLTTSEPLTGVKVTALCPGAVLTPMFGTTKMKQFTLDPEAALRPDTCAKHLLELLQKKEYPCGSMLELTLAGTRKIPEWGIEPSADMSTREKADQVSANALLQPIKDALDGERKQS